MGAQDIVPAVNMRKLFSISVFTISVGFLEIVFGVGIVRVVVGLSVAIVRRIIPVFVVGIAIPILSVAMVTLVVVWWTIGFVIEQGVQ